MNKKKVAYCILNAESVGFIKNHFNLSNSDLFCFDYISNQKVKILILHILNNLITKKGFISSSRFHQIRSFKLWDLF